MRDPIDSMVEAFEKGRVSRRELVGALAGLVAAAKASAEPSSSTFQAAGLNHIALGVPDIPRSRDFYVKHLGLEVSRESSGSCFMTCGEHFVALFRSSEPRMDHYCYAVADYDVRDAEAKLKEQNLSPRVHDRRIYFDDPDGLEVQLSAAGHRA